MAGWGQVFGKIADYIQGRSERRRNEIAKIKEQLDELTKKPASVANTKRYGELSARLSQLQNEAANANS